MSETQKDPIPEQKTDPAAPAPRKNLKQDAGAKSPGGSPGAPLISPPMLRVKDRHDVSFRHDMFMTNSVNCLRNISFKHLEPNIEKHEHVHVFHSHSSDGRKLSRTGSSCGHWHEVIEFIGKDGYPAAKCGPAKHEVTKIMNGRVVTRVEQVGFDREVKGGTRDGEVETVVDDHEHVLEYRGSEDLSSGMVARSLKEQRAEAAAMGIALGAGDVKNTTPAEMLPSDGATIA